MFRVDKYISEKSLIKIIDYFSDGKNDERLERSLRVAAANTNSLTRHVKDYSVITVKKVNLKCSDLRLNRFRYGHVEPLVLFKVETLVARKNIEAVKVLIDKLETISSEKLAEIMLII